MSVTTAAVNLTIKRITRLICRIDDSALERIPEAGPLILAANHINFLEVPLVYTHLQPRPVTGFAKAETWHNPALARLFNLWNAIPLKREEADFQAIKKALQVLKNGGILAVAPEGTRSGDGRLRRGHPGIVSLALHSRAPILPMVYYGGEMFRNNIKRLRRTDFYIVVGQSFYLDARGVKVTQEVRQQMVDEIMYKLAELLPAKYRGAYSFIDQATTEFISSDSFLL